MTDTIFALATGSQRAGVSILRVSGTNLLETCANKLSSQTILNPRYAYFEKFINPFDGTPLDEGLVIFFPNPNSFTGEDVLEFHIHGSQAVIEEFYDVFSKFGFRLAEPGEFTRRAFDNDKLDLTAVEGLADLIDAQTKFQKDAALRQLGGGLKDLYEGWRQKLIRLYAYIEAEIDFSDEDIPEGLTDESIVAVKNLITEIEDHLSSSIQGERLRKGIQVALIGPPNAGKSSLINELSNRDVAIVSNIPGTTRDSIEVHLNLSGYPVTLIDTAGLRETSDEIEKVGIHRTIEKAEEADFILYITDATQEKNEEDNSFVSFKEKPNCIQLINKIDQGKIVEENGAFLISVKEKKGLEEVLEHLTSKIQTIFSQKMNEDLFVTRKRYKQHLERSIKALKDALEQSERELISEELRLAANEIGAITGHFGVEDLLDVIFKDFCIGK